MPSSSNTAAISAVHVCTAGRVFVERGGKWYEIGDGVMAHRFAEIGNWSEEYWERHRVDPPCKGTAYDLLDYGRRQR